MIAGRKQRGQEPNAGIDACQDGASAVTSSVCLVSHTAYAALSGSGDGSIGGVQRQTSFVAKRLSARGHKVSMITWDEGQPDGELIDGVTVYKLCRQDAGIPGLRFLWPKWTSLRAAMRRADADVYYQNCAGYETGQVAMWCRRHKRGFIYSVASNPDCERNLPKLPKLRERILYRYGLRHADRVITQTTRQRDTLLRDFGVESTVIPMPCAGPGSSDADGAYASTGAILWLGRLCEAKRPDVLLDLAEANTGWEFDLVGPAGNGAYVADVMDRLERQRNVTVHGPVHWDRVSDFYRNASCLLCTSAFEGFPNTFLEAWSHGLPVVSTFDPDGVIASRELGIVAKDVAGLAAGIRRLRESPELWRRVSEKARKYVREVHSPDVVLPQFEKVLLSAIRGQRCSR